MKPNARSTIALLTPPQRERMETWLFDPKLSFTDVIEKTRGEFQVTLSQTALRRHYKNISRNRNLEKIVASRQTADGVVKDLKEKSVEVYQELLERGGQIAFDHAIKAEDIKSAGVVRDFIRVLTAARREDIQEKKYFLEREKWEFDVARTCANHLAELQEIIGNKEVDEAARLRAIRRRLFGDDLPD